MRRHNPLHLEVHVCSVFSNWQTTAKSTLWTNVFWARHSRKLRYHRFKISLQTNRFVCEKTMTLYLSRIKHLKTTTSDVVIRVSATVLIFKVHHLSQTSKEDRTDDVVHSIKSWCCFNVVCIVARSSFFFSSSSSLSDVWSFHLWHKVLIGYREVSDQP